MLVDLHMHTYYSDGTMSPEEIVVKGKEKNVGIMAITDHNRIGSWEAFNKAAKANGIIPIKGVEINAKFKNQVLHILGYGFNETEALIALLQKADVEMEQMSRDLIINLAKSDKRVSLADYDSYQYDVRKGGWKGIHYLLDRGITERLFQGFKFYKEYGCDFHEYEFPSLSEVCGALSEAGGYSVLAHPASYFGSLTEEELYATLNAIKEEGIQGIECYYPTHSEKLSEICANFCKAHNLLITTGSDEHGEFGKEAKTLNQTIGCLQIDEEKVRIAPLLEQIK